MMMTMLMMKAIMNNLYCPSPVVRWGVRRTDRGSEIAPPIRRFELHGESGCGFGSVGIDPIRGTSFRHQVTLIERRRRWTYDRFTLSVKLFLRPRRRSKVGCIAAGQSLSMAPLH